MTATVRYESTVDDGSVWAITDERIVDPATGMTRMHSGYRLEPSSNPARNQFGYEHAFTWEEARQMGITIWVEDDGGAIWCDDAEPAQAAHQVARRTQPTYTRPAVQAGGSGKGGL